MISSLGEIDGSCVGSTVKLNVGALVKNTSVGFSDGSNDINCDGSTVGNSECSIEGSTVVMVVGLSVNCGRCEGSPVGSHEGATDGTLFDGAILVVATGDGANEGSRLGCSDGSIEGSVVLSVLGATEFSNTDGFKVAIVGFSDGINDISSLGR